MPKDAPGGFNNEDAMSRPIGVAWTSARAKRCGFYFDPAKLKINYLSYERTLNAAADQLAKIEKTYDTTFRVTSEKIAAIPTTARTIAVWRSRPSCSGIWPATTRRTCRRRSRRQLRLLGLFRAPIGQAFQQQGCSANKDKDPKGGGGR